MTHPSIDRHDDGAVSCDTVLWRFRGRLQLTVVVKALFAVVPGDVATPAGPGAIVVKDRHRDGHPARSVEAASDLAPYLARCDVLFTGHAYAPGGRAPAGSVRLGISRDGRLLLDKTLHVFGDRAAAGGAPEPFARMPIIYEKSLGGLETPNPVGRDTPNLVDPADARRAAGFGPTSRYWPARRRLLATLDGKAIEAPLAEIPEAMPWEYFQAAPSDQQIEHLRGGEWLVLDGLHPTLARVQTRLPVARGAARVALRRATGPALEQTVELACDTLTIDGDRQTFSLTWRGRSEVPDDAPLPAIAVMAALETPGVPVDWARILGSAPRATSAAAPLVNLAATSLTFGTPSAPALPFANDHSAAAVLSRLPPSPAAEPRPKRSKETLALRLDQLPPLPETALPFAPDAPPSVPSRPPPPPAPVPPAVVPDGAVMPGVVPPPVVEARPTPPPPRADPWARPPEPERPSQPAPPRQTQRPPAFERPAADALKGNFYGSFKK